MTELITWLVILFVIVFVFGSAAYASFRAAPWLPLRGKDHDRVLRYIKGRKGLLYELGAGDARLLVEVAQKTEAQGVGFEISVLPFLAGWLRIIFSGTRGKTTLLFKDFFQEDFSKARTFYCFLTPPAMRKLKPKFERELQNGTRVISYSFEIHGWNPTTVDRGDGKKIPIFVYDFSR